VAPRNDPEAHSADLGRPSVRAALGALAAARGAYAAVVKAVETLVGFCIVGYLILVVWAQGRPRRRTHRR